MEYDTRCANCKERPVINDTPFARSNLYVVHKCSGVAVRVSKRILQLSTFVKADINDAMQQVDTWINRLNGRIDGVPLLITAYLVVAQLQRERLLIMEHILNDDKAAILVLTSFKFWTTGFILIPLSLSQLRDTYANTKLLAAIRTLEHQ